MARGLTWTLIDTWGSQLLALLIFIVLAQLLAPVDFGLVALAAVFVAFCQLLVDQGLGDAVIQRPSLTRRELDTAFWAALVTGALLTVIGILLSGPIAALLGDLRLAAIIQVLSIVFVLSALNSIQMGLFRREMDFRSLAVRKLIAIGAGGAVGIGFALMDFGAWALVAQQLTNALVSVATLWAVSPWRPSLAFSASDFRSLFSFGIKVVGGDVLNFFSRYTDNLLIGVVLGPVALGFYAIAHRILETSQILLIAAARRLVFPAFARLQHDLERTRRAYLRLMRATSALTLPGYIGLALVANEAIVVIFGDQWTPSAPTAAVLFTIGPVLTIQAFSGAVWNAVGHPEVTLRFRLISTVTNVVGFAIAVVFFREIVAVAAAFVIRGYLLLPLNLYWMRVYGGVGVRQQLSELRAVAAATAVMAAAVAGVRFGLLGGVDPWLSLAAQLGVGIGTFAVALAIFDRGLVRELGSVGLQVVPGGSRFGRGRRGAQPPSTARPPAVSPPVADELDEA